NNWTVDATGLNPSLDPSVPQRPGISVRNDTVQSALVSAMTANQKVDVTGLGFTASPLTPSVETTQAASTSEMLQMVTDILSAAGAGTGCGNGNNNQTLGNVQCIGKQNVGSGGQGQNAISLGTAANPQITELTNASAKIAGGSTGYGILI